MADQIVMHIRPLLLKKRPHHYVQGVLPLYLNRLLFVQEGYEMHDLLLREREVKTFSPVVSPQIFTLFYSTCTCKLFLLLMHGSPPPPCLMVLKTGCLCISYTKSSSDLRSLLPSFIFWQINQERRQKNL